MTQNEFQKLLSYLDELQMDIIQGTQEIGGPVGIWVDYKNNDGKRNKFSIINISMSPYPGCFEGDCFSDCRFDLNRGIGIEDFGAATTSHRTFKISNILAAGLL